MSDHKKNLKDWESLTNDEKAYGTLKLLIYGVTLCPADASVRKMIQLTFSPPIFPLHSVFFLDILRMLRADGRGAEAVQQLYARRKDGPALLSLEDAAGIYARACDEVMSSLPCIPVIPEYKRTVAAPEQRQAGPVTFGLARA